MRAWRRIDRLEEEFAERERHRSRHLHLYPDDDGMYVLRGRLPAEVGALLERALAAASEALYDQQCRQQPVSKEVPSYTQRQADAIGVLAEWALGVASASAVQPELVDSTAADEVVEQAINPVALDEETVVPPEPTPATGELPAEAAHVTKGKRLARTSRADRFQVVVHVDADALCAGSDSGQAVLAGGIRISAETSRRIACDASRVIMIHDKNGTVLDVGRRTRIVPTAIRRALEPGTPVADFQGAVCGFATRITSLIGPMAAKRSWRISSCFVGGIIALCTRKASV